VSGNAGLSSATSTPAKKTATAAGTPKTPRSRAKATPKKKKKKLFDIDEALDGDANDDDDDDEDVKSPSAAAGKRGARKASYVEKEDEGEENGDDKCGMHVSKRFKKEPVEEGFPDEAAEGEEI